MDEFAKFVRRCASFVCAADMPRKRDYDLKARLSRSELFQCLVRSIASLSLPLRVCAVPLRAVSSVELPK